MFTGGPNSASLLAKQNEQSRFGMFARQECTRLGVSFADAFRYQYVIARERPDAEGFRALRFGGFWVLAGRDLPVARLFDRDGAAIGLLLGIAVGRDGLIEGSHRFGGISAAAPGAADAFEAELCHIAGRYAVLLGIGHERRLYCDPVGTIGAVYNRGLGRVAASAMLCIDDGFEDHPLYDHAVNETGGGKYSLFHTRDARVRRLNPSFYLDLDNFQEYRFWPRGETFEDDPARRAGIYDEIIATARFNIGAIAARHRCALPLSGGRDSRLLAGFAGPHLARMNQIFTHVTNYSTRGDAEIARRIASCLGIPHEVHDKRGAAFSARRAARNERCFQIAAGAPVRAPDELRKDLQHAIEPGSVVLRGHQTDFLRAVFVPHTDRARWKDFRWQIAKLLIVPGKDVTEAHVDRFLPEYMAWHRTLPRAALAKAIDFMFLEVYYSASLGFTFPGLHRQFYMSPFNSRRLIELSLSIDDVYRRAGHAVDDILHRMSPELQALPFDDEFGPDLAAIDGPLPRRDARVAATRVRAASLAALPALRIRRRAAS